jgi:hypothetical protein
MWILLALLVVISRQPDERPYTLHTDGDQGNKDLYITFDLEQPQPVQLAVVDILGKQFANKEWENVTTQTFRVELPESANTIFIVRVFIDNKYYTNKVSLK